MGSVYRARHARLGKEVAIKVLASNLSRNTTLVERFEIEARVQAHLRHPNIVEVHDFIYADSHCAIVMDLVKGHSLDEIIHQQSGPMRAERCLALMGPTLEAVGYAHSQGVLHRDLKPSNIMVEVVSGKEVPRVTDFGIAKILADDGRRTATGSKLGTLFYMSPEQCRGARDIDTRADIYSLGVSLFEMAAGRVPFRADNDWEIYTMHIRDPPPSPRSIYPGVPEALEQVILTALAKEPDQRYQTAEKFLDALQQAVGPAPALSAAAQTARPGAETAMEETPSAGRSPSASEVMEAEKLTGEAIKQEKQNKLAEAASLLEQALAMNPHSRSARKAQERVLEQQRTDLVDRLCEEALVLLKDGPTNCRVAFEACKTAQRLAEGTEELETKTRNTVNQVVDMLYGHGVAFFRAGKIEQAVASMEEIQRRAPHSEAATKWLEDFQKDLSSSGLEMLRAKQLTRAGRLVEAEAAVREAMETGAPTDRAQALLNEIRKEHDVALKRVEWLITAGAMEEASTKAQEALKLGAPEDRVQMLLDKIQQERCNAAIKQARGLVKSGRLEEAKAEAQKAAKLWGSDDRIPSLLGQIQKKQNRRRTQASLSQIDALIESGQLAQALEQLGHARSQGLSHEEFDSRKKEATRLIAMENRERAARSPSRARERAFGIGIVVAVVAIPMILLVTMMKCGGS